MLACARPAAPPPAPPAGGSAAERVDVEGFLAPRSAEDFQLVETRPFPQRELGSVIRYATFYLPAARIDLFLFPVAAPKLFSLAAVLHEQNLTTIAEVAQQVKVAAFSGFEVLSQRIEPIAGTAPPLAGIRTDLAFVDRAGAAMRSHAFLAIRGKHFLKVRFTYPAEVAEVGDAAFERFLPSVVGATAASPEGDAVPLHAIVTRTTLETAAHGTQCAALAWGIGYGSEMHAALSRGEFVDSFERELAARSKALDLWEKLRRDGAEGIPRDQCVDASLDAMLELRRRGWFDEYVWSRYAKPYWSQPEGLDPAAASALAGAAAAPIDPVLETGVVIQFGSAP